MDNATYSAYFSTVMPYFRNFTVKINDVIEDAKANKVAIWAGSTADTDIRPYKNEYMLVFHLDESAEKVERMLEFVDSANSVEFFPRLKKYAEELNGKGG
jgi:ketosteroid isomerase-like protein